jgi:NNP family nitrate/nitrite transporter-like MFS transporter
LAATLTTHLSAARNQDIRAVPFWWQLGPISFLVLLFLLNFISRIILSPLLPTVERELGISHSQAGFLFFLISVGYLIGLLGSGFVVSRCTHRKVITISAAGVGVALIGVALSVTFWAVGAGLMTLGITAGLYLPSAVATITALTDQQHWGKAIAVHELAPNLAFFLAPFVAELFLKWSTWRMAFLALGTLSLLLSLGYRRWGRGGDFTGATPTSKAFRTLIRSAALWGMIALFGLGVSSTIGVYAMLPLYLVNERHMNLSWSNTLIALSRSYGPILGLTGGWVSDRLGPKQTMVVSLVFTGIVTLLLGIVSGVWLDGAVFFQPLLAVWFFPAAFAALALITPTAARHLAVAVTVPFGSVIGGGAIPTLIGFAGDAGSFALGFMLSGAVMIGGGFFALLLKMPETKP